MGIRSLRSAAKDCEFFTTRRGVVAILRSPDGRCSMDASRFTSACGSEDCRGAPTARWSRAPAAIRAGGEVKPDRRLLIHGAAAGVGGFAVQFAKAAGATVFATASRTSRDHVLGFGADVVIHRASERFEDRAKGRSSSISPLQTENKTLSISHQALC